MDVVLNILEEVADVKQSRPLDLPPLNDAVDVDSLEKIIDSLEQSEMVQFTYCQCRITVKGDGTIFIDTNETSMITDFH